jgi:hypothetical protein
MEPRADWMSARIALLKDLSRLRDQLNRETEGSSWTRPSGAPAWTVPVTASAPAHATC